LRRASDDELEILIAEAENAAATISGEVESPTIAHKIRSFREECGFSHDQLADSAECDSAVSAGDLSKNMVLTGVSEELLEQTSDRLSPQDIVTK
jgi:hypothetical protein